jgi:hypothetical protein
LLIFARQLEMIETVGAKDAAKELGKNIYDTVMSLEYKNKTANNKMQVVCKFNLCIATIRRRPQVAWCGRP